MELSFLFSVMLALGLIFATILSSLVLRENIPLMRLDRIVVVIVGVFMLARSFADF